MASRCQILDKHNIVNMFYSKLNSHRNLNLRVCLLCDIALRNKGNNKITELRTILQKKSILAKQNQQ